LLFSSRDAGTDRDIILSSREMKSFESRANTERNVDPRSEDANAPHTPAGRTRNSSPPRRLSLLGIRLSFARMNTIFQFQNQCVAGCEQVEIRLSIGKVLSGVFRGSDELSVLLRADQ
jgi:hypothetical protein